MIECDCNFDIKKYHTKTGKRIRLIHGDCMEWMKDCDKYDLAIVDPPYGINVSVNGSLNTTTSRKQYKKSEWDKEKPSKEYFDRLMRVSYNQIVWGGNYFSELWRDPCRGFIFWNKLNHFDERADGEMAWCSMDGLARCFEYMWDGNRYGFRGSKKNGVGKPSIRIHITEKPIALYRWLLQNYATEGDRIFDSHGGSMSHAIACWEEDFELDIIELDKDYYDSAVKRFEQHISQKTLF